MTAEDGDIRGAVGQWLETDRLLGLREVPLVLTPPTGAGSSVKNQASSEDAAEALRILDEQHVKGCQKCGLCAGRTNTAFGVGSAVARLMFVGEAPGFHEDKQGIPFVGRAGDLLTRMIGAMGLKRDDVYICNVLKCRPPNNRDPAADEISACSPYLFEQLRLIAPEVIVALGAPAARTLLDTGQSIGRLRGTFHDFHLPGSDGVVIPLMPTYHPAYLLRSPAEKGKTWADLQMVMQKLDLPLPKR